MTKSPKARRIRLGDRPVSSIGLNTTFWNDLYHRSMTVSWPIFMVSLIVTFFVLNLMFATLFALGDRPIANMASDSFSYYFYFSVETLGTVGYGDMHPQSQYGHIIASVETFSGLIFAAVITGMIFARFSRPMARVLFSNVLTISIHDGQRTLSARLANERHNTISNASAKLWVLRNERTLEGRQFRRFHEMSIVRNESPNFVLSWAIFHVIDEKSPLYNMTLEDIEKSDSTFILSVQGRDENFAQEVHARRAYSWRDLRWDVNFVNLFIYSDDGSFVLDYRRFHEFEAETAAIVDDENPAAS